LHTLRKAVDGVPKFLFSSEDIGSLFGRYFEIIDSREICHEELNLEKLDLENRHADGPIAAKTAYLMRKRNGT
jgi:hypothetical protein